MTIIAPAKPSTNGEHQPEVMSRFALGSIPEKCLDADPEIAVLGCMVFGGDDERLTEQHFCDEKNQLLFRAVVRMRANQVGIDQVTLVNELQEDEQYRRVCGNAVVHVVRVMEAVPHREHVDLYAGILHERLRKRRMVTAAQNVVRALNNGSGEVERDAAVRNAIATLQSGGETDILSDRCMLRFMDATEFSESSFKMRFLVKRVLVANQPVIIGGPKKSLKTSLLVDLALSLGTGKPFLDAFEVPQRVNVGILSGESGGFTLQETAKRIALSKGLMLSGSSTHWCFDLPMLSRPDHLQALVDVIREREFDVVIVDPAYLCLLDDGRAESAGNIFRMGNALRTFAQVGKDTDSTLILCHHSTKAAGRSFDPLELEDLSQSGFGEFARQWILVNRREPYEYGSGLHNLWMSACGSAGHSGLYGVDINEGVLQDDFSGRIWEVDVRPANKIVADKAAADAEQKKTKAETILQSRREDIIKVMEEFPDGETKTAIRQSSPLNSGNFEATLSTLIDDGTVIRCQITKDNGRKYPGFKLASGTPGTGTGDSSVPTVKAHTGDTPSLWGGVSRVCASGEPAGTDESVPDDFVPTDEASP